MHVSADYFFIAQVLDDFVLGMIIILANILLKI